MGDLPPQTVNGKLNILKPESMDKKEFIERVSRISLSLDNGEDTIHRAYLQVPIRTSSTEFSFTFNSVLPGAYNLEISSDFWIPKLTGGIRVDVSAKNLGKIKVRSIWDRSQLLDYPIEISLVPATFFDIRPPFNILSLFKNPMILMSGIMILTTVALPKCMNSIDPEAMAELQQKPGENDPRFLAAKKTVETATFGRQRKRLAAATSSLQQ